jgi:beta-galactosidase
VPSASLFVAGNRIVGNGDPNCQESVKQPNRSLFNGLEQVILQSTRTAGAIEIGASTNTHGATITPAKLTITAKKRTWN